MTFHEAAFPVWELVHAALVRGQRYTWRCTACLASFVAAAREREDRTLRCPPCPHCHSPITCVDESSPLGEQHNDSKENQ